MSEIDINDIPQLQFDPGIPDAKWGGSTSTATTSVYEVVVAIISN